MSLNHVVDEEKGFKQHKKKSCIAYLKGGKLKMTAKIQKYIKREKHEKNVTIDPKLMKKHHNFMETNKNIVAPL